MTEAVKSDGGSSSYYELEINNSDRMCIKVEMNDVVRDVFDNQFDLGNMAKALRRIAQARNGTGKEGTSIEYDLKKIIWFAEEELKHIQAGK